VDLLVGGGVHAHSLRYWACHPAVAGIFGQTLLRNRVPVVVQFREFACTIPLFPHSPPMTREE
jgi:hypothetical protein